MSNLSKKRTGLDMIVWISSCHRPLNKYEIPRLKFQDNVSDKIDKTDLIPISISDNPTILIKSKQIKTSTESIQKLASWIKKNKNVLLRHWNDPTYTSDEVIDDLQKL